MITDYVYWTYSSYPYKLGSWGIVPSSSIKQLKELIFPREQNLSLQTIIDLSLLCHSLFWYSMSILHLHFALSYFFSLMAHFWYCCSLVEPKWAGTAAMISAFFLIFGIVSGVNFTLVIAKLVEISGWCRFLFMILSDIQSRMSLQSKIWAISTIAKVRNQSLQVLFVIQLSE